MSCYWEHLREHIGNFENKWEPDRNVLELDGNSLGSEKKTKNYCVVRKKE
jgi:hypothetical protein